MPQYLMYNPKTKNPTGEYIENYEFACKYAKLYWYYIKIRYGKIIIDPIW